MAQCCSLKSSVQFCCHGPLRPSPRPPTPPAMALLLSTFCPRIPATLRRASLSVRPSSFPASSRRAATICSQISDGGLAEVRSSAELSVGFLGLGIMGSPMARNLINAGYKPSPADVAASCDVTFAMLSDPQSATLLWGKMELLMESVQGKGDASLYETVSPLLDIMGKSKFYLGEVGNGASMKLVVNMIMGSMMATFSEGLLLGEKLGLDPNVLIEVVSQGAISAPMFSMKGPSMVKSSYPTAFPLKHQQKDLRLALGLAESVSQSTPIAAAANELYKVAKSLGLSDQDFSAVMEALRSKTQQS